MQNIEEKARPRGNHSVIFGTLNNKPVVLKSNANPSFVSRTLTEIYTLLELDGHLDAIFSVPKILDFDFSEQKYLWFLTELNATQYLVGNTAADVEVLAHATNAILRSDLKVPLKDAPRLEKLNANLGQELLNKLKDLAVVWQKEINIPVTDLIDTMMTYSMSSVPPIPVHGDLVARHILKLENDKFQIYDWELAGGAYFYGYEPAYVFHRTYTRDGTPELAQVYLDTLLKNSTDEEIDNLKLTFKPMLAQRLLGGYKDYSDTNSREFALNTQLHSLFNSSDFC